MIRLFTSAIVAAVGAVALASPAAATVIPPPPGFDSPPTVEYTFQLSQGQWAPGSSSQSTGGLPPDLNTDRFEDLPDNPGTFFLPSGDKTNIVVDDMGTPATGDDTITFYTRNINSTILQFARFRVGLICQANPPISSCDENDPGPLGLVSMSAELNDGTTVTGVTPTNSGGVPNNPASLAFKAGTYYDFEFVPAPFAQAVTFNRDALVDHGIEEINIYGVSQVPVPATLPLLLGALGGIGYIARRRRKAAAAV